MKNRLLICAFYSIFLCNIVSLFTHNVLQKLFPQYCHVPNQSRRMFKNKLTKQNDINFLNTTQDMSHTRTYGRRGLHWAARSHDLWE